MAELNELVGFEVTADIEPGEQLQRSHFVSLGFESPEPEPNIPEPNIAVAMPTGHSAHVLVLPSARAVGGFARAGDSIRVVATSLGSHGRAVSTTLLTEVEVVGFDIVLADGATATEQREYAVTIAVKPNEAAKLAAAVADSAVLTLAAMSQIPDEHTIVIEMTREQALGGTVRAGDVATIVTDGVVVASEVEVMNVSADIGTESRYSIVVSVDDEQLLTVISAMADGDVSLAEG